MAAEKIITKIRNLLALKASSNEHEAALAAEKATELLLKYNVSLDEVMQKKSEYSWQEREKFANTTWKLALYTAIGKANLCRVIYDTKKRIAHVVGRKHNIEVVEYLYTYLTRTIDRLADEAWTEYHEQYPYSRVTIRKFKAGFRLGATSEVIKRLERVEEEADKDCKALILVNSQALATEVQKRFGGSTRENYMRVSSSYTAYQRGRAAGASIAINPGVSGTQVRKKIS
ncbi:DUF2786 domain-containing protein [Ktedonospora formicarum]|uniref:DUF2786 domain-containing protein n=1 Tax=Ktedonospora formicarum TaxID=2778364 RepID=A0A8J3I1P7_9CHLR|nr:DUF2786 domain-containing protein [Ktedonospora formicarum]GHO45165.1 hypothetical protein KSX_33280 [Ktedonospora formicarum]